MVANANPIYSRTADIQWIGDITAANTNQDLTSGTSYLIFTADATEGGFVREVRIKANPANATNATVARIWINNGATTGTASNSALYSEFGIPATSASDTLANVDFCIPLNIALPAGYRLYLTLGTAPGGSGEFTATAIGGKY
jgi:hypothetical protein